MSTNLVPIAIRDQPWQQLTNEIVIGKDILELLSGSMYVDPLTIYREYIQNAADAADEARAQGLLGPSKPGRVSIRIDPNTRNVTITDNATGIAYADFATRLTAFGASKKRGRGARGFRGVGRLAGIGYCQELFFRSRTPGDPKVSEMRWDCRKLKSMLRLNDSQDDLRHAVSEVVELRRIPACHSTESFFEVEMRSIIRHRNDRLLNASAIKTYLAQVGPVPFRKEFRFREEILRHLSSRLAIADLQVFVGDDTIPVHRPHQNELEISPGVFDRFADLELLSIEGINGDTACLGWLLHHGYTGALPTACNVRGFRVRSGNIQIGDEWIFEELFPEVRFNAWTVGELHVIDPRIIPNGRRDHFEQSVHFDNLLTHLTPIARDIARRCRTSSIQRKWSRDFELRETEVNEKAGIIKQGALARPDRYRLTEEIRAGMAILDRIINRGMLSEMMITDLKKRKHRLELCVNKVLKAPVRTALADFPAPKRRAYEQLIGLIYECSASQSNAKVLVDKILARLS